MLWTRFRVLLYFDVHLTNKTPHINLFDNNLVVFFTVFFLFFVQNIDENLLLDIFLTVVLPQKLV